MIVLASMTGCSMSDGRHNLRTCTLLIFASEQQTEVDLTFLVKVFLPSFFRDKCD